MRIASITERISPIPMGNGYGGGKWEVVKEFNGRSHKDGGIDIEVSEGFVRHINAPYEKPDEIAKNGRVWKSIGAGLYGAGEGLLDTITLGATDKLTDLGYEGLQKLGGSTADEIREQNSIRGYGTTAGAITGGILSGGAATGSAIQQGAKGLGAGISQGSPESKAAQAIGTYLPLAGSIAGMATGNAGYSGATGAAASMGKVASATQGLGKYSPYINMASGLLNQPTTPMEGVGMVSNQINAMMPMMSSRTPSRQAERELGMSGKKPGQSGYGDMDGYAVTPTIGQPSEGPIQFRMPPVYQAESANYLGRYGINV